MMIKAYREMIPPVNPNVYSASSRVGHCMNEPHVISWLQCGRGSSKIYLQGSCYFGGYFGREGGVSFLPKK